MKLLPRILGSLWAALSGFVVSADACGIEWSVPQNHFDGVNELGELSYWRSIGDVDFGDGWKVPLVIGFKSTRGGASCLGKGWIVPILESNIVQIDDRRFLLTQPDGITRQFWRKSPSDSVLYGQGNWKGDIKGDTIRLWAECGWKLSFTTGKIDSITTPSNRVLNVVYRNGSPSEILEGARTVLAVERETLSGQVSGFSFKQNRIGIELGDKPRVEVIQGVKVIGGVERSLHKLNFLGGESAVFDYGVDEKIQPTLTISGDTTRSFTWKPETGCLLKDGGWRYEIKPSSDRYSHVEVTRFDSQNQTEYWFRDPMRGVEYTRNREGKASERKWFTTGTMAGKLRLKRETNRAGEIVEEKYSYDDNGNLLRDVVETRRASGSTQSKPEVIQGQLSNISLTDAVNVTSNGFVREFKGGILDRERLPDGSEARYESVGGNIKKCFFQMTSGNRLEKSAHEELFNAKKELIEIRNGLNVTSFARNDVGAISEIKQNGRLVESRVEAGVHKYILYYRGDGRPDFAVDASSGDRVEDSETLQKLAQNQPN